MLNPKIKKVRLGDLLIQQQQITATQLEQALADVKKTGRRLGRVLIEQGHITEPDLNHFLAEQLGLSFVDLKKFKFKPETARRLPETHARRFRAIPLEETPTGFLVGMVDPTDIFAMDELDRILQAPITPAIVSEPELLRTVDMIYRRTDEIASLAGELGEEMAEGAIDLSQLIKQDDVSDAPVVKLLQSLFEDAVQVGASDIHIEPDEKELRIRQRVDGMLQEQVMKEKHIASALILRLKLMSGLNISEKRLPQDGRFHIRVKNRNIDVRLSTLPVQHGESAVMRLLDQSAGILELEQLGMDTEMLRRFRRLVHHPHGMVLVTGPTGSGKTTTLYAVLNELNQPDKKIITAEDPVEYRLSSINQVQVKSAIGLTFSSILRSTLRQDPDIILVGEMRDQETVEIGLRAAMTGHLVLSTLHTNDAITTANRLIDMGAEGYLVAASLLGVIAQRLIRKVCDNCAQPYEPDAHEQSWLNATLGDKAKGLKLQKGAGCQYCHDTGYQGRFGIFELLEIDAPLADALRQNDSALFTRLAMSRPHFKPLVHSALEYAGEGLTSLDEVFRIAGEIEEHEPATDAEASAEPNPADNTD
jgi:MSHA biogenesis protein MshE